MARTKTETDTLTDVELRTQHALPTTQVFEGKGCHNPATSKLDEG